MPARLIDDFDLTDAGLLLLVAFGFASLGWAAFHAGLRRYTSGSSWGRG